MDDLKPQADTTLGGSGEDDSLARLIARSGRRIQAPADMQQRVRAAVAAEWQQRQQRRRNRQYVQVALAATLALAVGVSLIWNGSNPALSVPGPQALAAASVQASSGLVQIDGAPSVVAARVTTGSIVATSVDGRVALQMAGGASVRVDHNSRLRIDGPAAVALLDGALYVDAQLHEGFVVSAAGIRVRDVGTQFDVRLRPRLQVGVREGAVLVANADDGHLRAELVAVDGMGALVDLEDGDRVRRLPSTDRRWQWAEDAAPRMDINGVSPARYLNWVARETGRNLQFASEAAAQRALAARLGGRFQAVELRATIPEVLAMADLVEVAGRPGELVVDVSP